MDDKTEFWRGCGEQGIGQLLQVVLGQMDLAIQGPLVEDRDCVAFGQVAVASGLGAEDDGSVIRIECGVPRRDECPTRSGLGESTGDRRVM